MNENKRLIIFLVAMVAFITLIVTISIITIKKHQALYDEFISAYEGDKPTLVYIGRTSCGYCTMLNLSMDDIQKRYGIDYIYFDTDKYSSSYMNKVIDKLELTDFGTPYLAIVGNNKIIDVNNGYVEYEVLFDFLQRNSIISEEEELLLNYIDYSQYQELISSDELQLIVIGASGCQYCMQSKIVLNELIAQYDVNVNYLDTEKLTEEEFDEMIASLPYFEENPKWGTPLFIAVKDNELSGVLAGYQELSQYVSFLEDQGVINE